MAKTNWTLLTPPSQGAIAIIQLSGDVSSVLTKLTGRSSFKEGSLYRVNISDIDEAVAVQINPQLAQIMPHGSVHILRKLAIRFKELGIEHADEPQYPEAKSEIEVAMLRTLAIAKSPIAIPLLLQQPQIVHNTTPSHEDLHHTGILNHLITPPAVVLLGAPNTGKSTLMNALTKQDTSIVHHLPGATRDAVGARINCGGLVIDLYDLPGFRDSSDPIEQKAIALAKTIASDAVLTILITDSEHEWLETTRNSIAVATKSDIQSRDDADICVSAQTGENVEELAIAIRDAIIPPDVLQSEGPWVLL